MLVLTRKNRESVVIGRADGMQVALEITILEIEGGRVRLGFEADTRMPIHRREVWDRICNGEGNGQAAGPGDGRAAGRAAGRDNGRAVAGGAALAGTEAPKRPGS